MEQAGLGFSVHELVQISSILTHYNNIFFTTLVSYLIFQLSLKLHNFGIEPRTLKLSNKLSNSIIFYICNLTTEEVLEIVFCSLGLAQMARLGSDGSARLRWSKTTLVKIMNQFLLFMIYQKTNYKKWVRAKY